MRNFSLKSLIFILSFFLTSFIIQKLIYTSLRNIDIGNFGVLNKIVEGRINSDILILGSSRGYVNFDPIVISENTGLSSYNISQNGTRFGVQLSLLKTYLQHNIPPKILIQEIGVYSLVLETGIYEEFKYLPYLYEDSLYQGLLRINENLWMQKYIPPATFYYFDTDFQRRVIRDITLSWLKGSDYLINGYAPHNIPWNVDEDKFLQRNKNGLHNGITQIAIDHLLELIDVCKKNNITLLFVNTPEFYKIIPLQKRREEIIKIFQKYANESGNYYLDYTEAPINKEKNNFYNFTHLNEQGAKIFSKEIAQEMIRIGLTSRSENKPFNK